MKKIHLCAVFFPVLGLLSWCLSLQLKASFGREVRLRIEGYDPRDLLSGHYLQFRLSLTRSLNCPNTSNSASKARVMCACLTPSTSESSLFEGVDIRSCSEAKKTCVVFLQGTCQGASFSSELDRYYIPETYSQVLSVLPEGASVSVALDSEGEGVITKMFVGGQTVEAYAEGRLRESNE
jgi:uncharacterized membrane-anchored protein